jgi:hypothetical protein
MLLDVRELNEPLVTNWIAQYAPSVRELEAPTTTEPFTPKLCFSIGEVIRFIG